MWEDSLVPIYKHRRYRAKSEPNIQKFLAAAEGGNHLPLYALSDYLEEQGHPAAHIIRDALNRGKVEVKYPGHRRGSVGWHILKHNSTHPLVSNNEHEVRKYKDNLRPDLTSNHLEAMFRTPTHWFTFRAPITQKHLDYLHSTGMPPE